MANKTILIIEDNESNRDLFKEILSIGNYEVLEAEDAEKGLALLNEHMPDLVLMDIQLPGMDGLAATHIIKKNPATKNIPVVALTAYAMEGDREQFLNAGCDGYISKPINTRSFLATIAGHLQNDHCEQPIRKSVLYKNNILIVDDEPMNLKLLEVMIPKEKYEVSLAHDGYEAMEKAQSENLDLILLDVMMPGIDGFAVTRQLKNDPRTSRVPIILVTVLDDAESKVKGLEAGADEFLNKPVNAAELLARMNSVLRIREFQEQLSIRSNTVESFRTPAILKEMKEAVKEELPSIVLVDDNEKDSQLIMSQLEGEPYRIKLIRDGREILERAQQEKIDLLILDILLPGIDGLEICRRLKTMENTQNIQIIMITCLRDLETKIQSVKVGSDDFLVKPIDGREMRIRIKNLLEKKQYIDKLRLHYETALSSAMSDGLTKLYNQSYFKHFLNLEVKRSIRQKYPVSLIMIDIDDFKQYNDTQGHLAGDQVLQNIAKVIRSRIREVDLAARYGGEEFAVVLPYADSEGVQTVAERIRLAILSDPALQEKASPSRLTVSLGIAVCPLHASTMEELIEQADFTLYKAKHEGKNRILVHD